jgi:U4/U6.U5 tri-snRNP-associated protein 1
LLPICKAEGDELISTDLAERERLKERLDFKKKKPTYNSAYDDDDETGEKRLLSQYDDDEDKRRYKKRFILDGTDNLETNQAYRQEIAEKLKSKAISLDLPSRFLSNNQFR